jgi:hypothetical protein
MTVAAFPKETATTISQDLLNYIDAFANFKDAAAPALKLKLKLKVQQKDFIENT